MAAEYQAQEILYGAMSVVEMVSRTLLSRSLSPWVWSRRRYTCTEYLQCLCICVDPILIACIHYTVTQKIVYLHMIYINSVCACKLPCVFTYSPLSLSLSCPNIGLSPDLHDLDQIRSISRPLDVPEGGLLCDLLWSDPEKDLIGWGDNDRGVSFTFGSDVVTKFLNKHGLDLICRAHQVRGGLSGLYRA